MKSKTLMFVTTMTLSVALALPVNLAAQRTGYKLVDLGTLGGPNSQVNGSPPPMINNRGVVAGMADTLTPCGYLGGFVSPAVKWENGIPSNLGLLPGGCSSLPNSINSKGMIVGSGDIGVIDPVTGLPEIRADLRYKGQFVTARTGARSDTSALPNTGAERIQIGGMQSCAGSDAAAARKFHRQVCN